MFKICEFCGDRFESKRSDSRYCRPAHRVAAHRGSDVTDKDEPVTDNPVSVTKEAISVTAPVTAKTWTDGWKDRLNPIEGTISCYTVPGVSKDELYLNWLQYHGGPQVKSKWDDTVCMYLTDGCMNPMHQREGDDPIIEKVNRA